MSQTLFIRNCCENEKTHIAHFHNEPSALLCDVCIQDESLLIGAKIVNLKTRQEVSV